MTFVPACGQCRWCSSGKSYLCDNMANMMKGPQLDGTFRMHTRNGDDAGQFCFLGTFSQYVVVPELSVVRLEPHFDMTKVCIVGCAVPTGFGSSVNVADVQPGETVAVFGCGGVGSYAVQGAVVKGAAKVIAVDPVDFKLDMAKQLGATHVINPQREDPVARIMEITNWVGAEKAVICIDLVTPEDIGIGFNSICKGGRLVVTGVANISYDHADFGPWWLTQYAKQVVGTIYGNSPVQADLPRYLGLYAAGKLKVDELITRTYTLDRVNDAFNDMLEGKNIRGVIVHE
jgi:S-(hydroxymethyl)glutathione dehydrogenase/alcohol dehydrogenase